MPRIMILDLETQNHPFFGAVASPRHPENYVVAAGWAIDNVPYDGEIQHTYHTQREDWLHIPDDVWLLVAHNAPFEMDWALVQQRPEIMKFLARGGRVFCTAYAEYLLSNQQKTYPSLDETAPDYGGTHKVDGIKILWEQGVLTSNIDKELLLEYLVGPSGDIENTRKVFYGQYAALLSRGMWDMALVRMEGMLSNCFAMDAGLFVDREVSNRQLAEGLAKIGELKNTFATFRTSIPEHVQFKDSSDYSMSAWLFGGPIKYKIQDTWFEDDGVTPKYQKADFWKFTDGHRERTPDNPPSKEWIHELVKAHGPVLKAAAGKSKGQPRVYREDTDEVKLRWYERQHQCGGIVPIGLLPKDIQKSFKDEFSGKRKLADDSPVYSTGKDCIEMLSKRQEFSEDVRAVLASLLEFAKVDKDIGTYYLREDLDEEGNVVKQSGMLQYLTPWDIVYHTLNCTATVTTRLSSNRPNMQNLPRGDTSNVKNMFASRFNSLSWLAWAFKNGHISKEVHDKCSANIVLGKPNGKIIEADYSALEVVTLAAFSKDKNLVKALLDGIDMHCMRLSQGLKEEYASVYEKCHDKNQPDHKTYKTLRTDIKPKAFAYQYGATAHGIAFATGCTVESAQEFIDTEKALFPEVESFYDEKITKAVEANVTRHTEQTETGGWRVYLRGVWQSPGGTCYEFRQFPKGQRINGQWVELMNFKPTQIRNYPIQGESGYFVQGMAGHVIRWLIGKNFFNGMVYFINQVHDAFYFDCHVDYVDEVCRTVKQIMESLPSVFNAMGYDLGVPFPAEVEFGLNMNSKEKWVEGSVSGD